MNLFGHFGPKGDALECSNLCSSVRPIREKGVSGPKLHSNLQETVLNHGKSGGKKENKGGFTPKKRQIVSLSSLSLSLSSLSKITPI